MRKFSILLALIMMISLSVKSFAEENLDLDMDNYQNENEISISDPLEPVNRFFFQVNDKIFHYLLNPAAKVYAAVLPEDVRMCVGNAFHNLMTPVRVVNNLLQGKIADSGTEIARFVINTTAGSGGLADPAKDVFQLNSTDEDFGQTLGSYGVGGGIYFVWPILGPSNLRDTIGLIGDSFLSPITYLGQSDSAAGIAAHTGKIVNKASLSLGEYEQFLESSFDPYIAMRDFYTQNRRSRVEDRDIRGDQSVINTVPKAVDLGIALVKASPVIIRDEQTSVPDEITLTLPQKGQKKYFVQVGAFKDPINVELMVSKLISLNKSPAVLEYDRKDYKFYGVVLPGGSDFISTKNLEIKLSSEGFSETMVVLY